MRAERSTAIGSGRPPPHDFNEDADGNACWTPRDGPEVRLRVGGAGDVEVDPRVPLGKLLEEERGSDRARGSATGILDVCDVALDDLLVVVPHGQRPAGFAG